MSSRHRRSSAPESASNLRAGFMSRTPQSPSPQLSGRRSSRHSSPLRSEILPEAEEINVPDSKSDTRLDPSHGSATAQPTAPGSRQPGGNSNGANQIPSIRRSTTHQVDDDPDGFKAQFMKKRAMKNSWHTSTLSWRKNVTQDSFKDGRVMIVDYIHTNGTDGSSKIQIAHQEIEQVDQLYHFYANRARCSKASLRIIHVQNASWATKFLLRRYNIDSHDDLVGTDFARWARFESPEWRAGKPLLKGRTWRPQRDPWRSIRRTAFGMDYLRPYNVRDVNRPWQNENDQLLAKMMELNCYDDEDGATYGWDVFVQRTSVYVQWSDGQERAPPPDIRNPYQDPEDPDIQFDGANGHFKEVEIPHPNGWGTHFKKKRPLPLDELDNGNAIIIFEHSQTGSVKDTLIGARQQIESRWRRMTFFLPTTDLSDEDRLAVECMNAVLEDVFKALSASWDDFLNITETHVSILEDKIYDSPADESRAPELWNNSNAWLKVEKLIGIHNEVVKETINRLDDVVSLTPEGDGWLDGVQDEFQKISNLVQEDLVKPTANLSDLMYKSVGIRDSRQSLQLGTSMWRLSWITFIFLPLTFIVGFFGMNVDTFENNPSIKWYFVGAVPFMLTILVCWYVLKHLFAARRQTPYQRGVYEHLFHDLAVENSELWTRGGPRRHLKIEGFWGRLQWRLLTYWFDPKKTVLRAPDDPDVDNGGSGLGAWARLKRTLARRWLSSIRVAPRNEEEVELGPSSSDEDYERRYRVAEGLRNATAVALVEAEPSTHEATQAGLERLSPPPQPVRQRTRRRSSVGSAAVSIRPSSSGGSSGYMVEEGAVSEENQENLNGWNWDHAVRRSIDATLMETLDRARP